MNTKPISNLVLIAALVVTAIAGGVVYFSLRNKNVGYVDDIPVGDFIDQKFIETSSKSNDSNPQTQAINTTIDQIVQEAASIPQTPEEIDSSLYLGEETIINDAHANTKIDPAL